MTLSAITQGRIIPALSVELRWKSPQRASSGASTGRTLNVRNVDLKLTRSRIWTSYIKKNGSKKYHKQEQSQMGAYPIRPLLQDGGNRRYGKDGSVAGS